MKLVDLLLMVFWPMLIICVSLMVPGIVALIIKRPPK
jgi:hypothetical protein